MENNKYKLVGYFNYFQIVPDLVYPIYMDKDKKLYWGFSDNGSIDDCECYFTKFLEFPERYKENVVYLTDCIYKQEKKQDYYQLGDLIVSAIEIEDKVLYIGPIEEFQSFLKSYVEDFLKPDAKEHERFIKILEEDIAFHDNILNKARESGILDQIKQKRKENKRRR